jgi:cyclic pyranopterin phosphate synthase
LTSSGVLRPCLGHDGGADLKALLRGGASDTELYTVMQEVMYHKPRSGAFETSDACMNMNTIGG